MQVTRKFSLFLLAINIIYAAQVSAADERILKYKILENISTEDCPFIGTVFIKTRYRLKHFTSDTADIQIRVANEELIYETLLIKEVEAGRGRTTLSFDVGECAQEIQVVLVNN